MSDLIKTLPNGQWALEKAQIFDFKSKKMIADVKPPKIHVEHAGVSKDGKSHNYHIHMDGKKIGDATVGHHDGNVTASSIDTTKHPEIRHHLEHISDAIHSVHKTHSESKMKEHNARAKIAGRIHPEGYAHQKNIEMQHGKPPVSPSKKKIAKSLDNGQQTLEKSNYGPKGAKLYSDADNVRRKASNVGIERFGNQSVKSYTGHPFQHKEPSGAASVGKKFTPEEIEAYKQRISKEEVLKTHTNGQWQLVEKSKPMTEEEARAFKEKRDQYLRDKHNMPSKEEHEKQLADRRGRDVPKTSLPNMSNAADKKYNESYHSSTKEVAPGKFQYAGTPKKPQADVRPPISKRPEFKGKGFERTPVRMSPPVRKK